MKILVNCVRTLRVLYDEAQSLKMSFSIIRGALIDNISYK